MLYGAGEGQPLAAARATACIGLSMYIRRERHIGEGAAAASQRHKALQLLQMTINKIVSRQGGSKEKNVTYK